jgi:hypothetical protein
MQKYIYQSIDSTLIQATSVYDLLKIRFYTHKKAAPARQGSVPDIANIAMKHEKNRE